MQLVGLGLSFSGLRGEGVLGHAHKLAEQLAFQYTRVQLLWLRPCMAYSWLSWDRGKPPGLLSSWTGLKLAAWYVDDHVTSLMPSCTLPT